MAYRTIHRRRSDRRGAVLLIVLSLLVIFVLIGITFVLVASRYRQGAVEYAKDGMQGDPPRKLFEETLSQVLVGPRTPYSCLWQHDLLGDLYGKDGVLASLDPAGAPPALVPSTGGQFFSINIVGNAGFPLSGEPGEYVGRVLTVTSGNAVGLSSRIVGYTPTGGNTASVMIEALKADAATPIGTLTPGPAETPTAQILINGACFNGTGAGFEYDGSSALKFTRAMSGGYEMALMPNFSKHPSGEWPRIKAMAVNEPWDAADYQTMALTVMRANGTVELPSFHRSDLINYWNTRGLWGDASVRARVMFRPDRDPQAHPDFTGSNPGFHPVNGPWDIDNDGDGIPDSIWIDIGLPARAMPNGQMYKPLVAIMIQDLDGRFDANAHGNAGQVAAGGTYPALQAAQYAGNNTPSTPTLKRGQGYGPAGIDFRHVIVSPPPTSPPPLDSNAYANFLLIRYNGGGPGQNGEEYTGGSFFKESLLPGGGSPHGYGSPSDIWDKGALGVDSQGHPIFQQMASSDEQIDTPYEMNPHKIEYGPQAPDAPYTLVELEALLRRFDPDAYKLPQRLRALVGDNSSRIFTVRTSHIPVSAGMLPAALRVGDNHLHDRMEALGVSNPADLLKLLPTEVLKGGKMNLNRRWGDGLDNNGNGTIDEPGEGYEPAWNFGGSPPAGYAGGSLTNYLNYGLPSGSDAAAVQYQNRLKARQAFARHLYVLAMALGDNGYAPPMLEGGLNSGEYKARRIAQWAINCVDYRDPDAIMTPFEYDADLANGWDAAIDDSPATDELALNTAPDRRLVWGCEFPDLLLTEAVAWHDKRLKDTAMDADGKKLKDKDTNMAQVETDLDQWRVPQGTLIIELYCPRAPQSVAGMPGGNAALPRELYPNGSALDLAKVAPGGAAVWRVALSQAHNGNNSAFQIASANPESAQYQPEAMVVTTLGAAAVNLPVERYVYFTTGVPTGGSPDNSYFRQGGTAELSPGGYAVVGPRTTTVLGVNKDGTDTTLATLALQRVILTAGAGSIQIDDAAGGSVTTNNILGIICAANPVNAYPRSGMNVSEPIPQTDAYYGAPGRPEESPPPSKTLYTELDAFDDPANDDPAVTVPDAPFDYKGGRPLEVNNVTNSGTHVNHRTAFLQRLADPTQPFDPNTNPYVTIDWKPIDLTVFNGEDRKDLQNPALPGGFIYDAKDNNPDWTTMPSFGLAAGSPGTRQSGDANYNIWSQQTVQPGQSTGPDGNAMFAFSLKGATLGKLNTPMLSAGLGGSYINAGQQPFPWLNIANRPFVSAYELLQVPASSPNRLLHEFTLGTLVGANPYGGSAVPDVRAPYAHLLNFLHTSPAAAGGMAPASAANLHRIFDYVEVASRYSGAETWLNADIFGGAATGTPGVEYFRPPFNYVQRFQDPGLVNINTIFESTVWDGGNGFGGVGGGRNPLWANLRVSRQGYADGNDTQYPSKFSNPFRPGWAADLVPLDNMLHPEVDVTLLRRAIAGTDPLFAGTTTGAHDDPQRHAYFRYEPLVAAGNKVKCTSNVFAVWMTVGFFQVQSTAPTQYVPDGWQLGPELGIDTGEITRHRAFYMIDRSIPVGYQPGEAHNTERCVLLRRYLD